MRRFGLLSSSKSRSYGTGSAYDGRSRGGLSAMDGGLRDDALLQDLKTSGYPASTHSVVLDEVETPVASRGSIFRGPQAR